MGRSFAYVAGGRLRAVLDGAAPRELDSEFARSVHERSLEIQRRHAWKKEGRGAGFAGLLWGGTPWDPGFPSSAVTSVTRRPGTARLCYSLVADRLTAICAREAAAGPEQRLLHGSQQRIVDLAYSPDGERIACAVLHPDGTGSIAVMTADATELVELTEGDSVDRAPAWSPDGRRVVYQSAGVGRNPEGHPVGLGASQIHALDLERGEIETLASDPGHDLVSPRLAPDGALLFVRRPRTTALAGSFLRSLLDFVLFPARLLYALFQYLNFFTARYTGRPLTTAGGPKGQSADLRRLLEQTRLAQASEGSGEAEDEAEAGVPRSWKLVRREPSGAEEVVAAGVSCYDLSSDSALVFSTGTRLYLIEPDNPRRVELGSGDVVSAVVALD